jgi:hypothetical protein
VRDLLERAAQEQADKLQEPQAVPRTEGHEPRAGAASPTQRKRHRVHQRLISSTRSKEVHV